MTLPTAHLDPKETIERFALVPGGLIPALHALQGDFGFVDRDLIPVLAEVFNITTAEVHGVISFYHDFRTEPPHGPVVQVCRAEACQARGGEAKRVELMARADGPVEFTDVYCLGNCALGPSVSVHGRLFADPDPAEVLAFARTGLDGPPASGLDAEPANSGTVVYVPRDAAARSVGADAVADAFVAAGARVIRNGSRGALWMEPMVEVVAGNRRVAYGSVTPADAAAILEQGGSHALHLGPTDGLPWFARQERVTFARVGVVDPRSPDDFEAHGGNAGLRRALTMTPADVVAEVAGSGLRGRGGAAFPTDIKMRTVLDTASPIKFVVCNADEGDSGTFADRMLIEGDPFTLIEGMTIAAWAVQAGEGYVYVRSEYPDAIEALREAISAAEARQWLGDDVLGSGFAFRLHVRVGAGSYVCGEETAMLESLEGKRGVVRAKPPLPAIEGLWRRPTLVNNVLTLAALPAIVSGGAAAYAATGSGRSRGTCAVQLAGNIAQTMAS